MIYDRKECSTIQKDRKGPSSEEVAFTHAGTEHRPQGDKRSLEDNMTSQTCSIPRQGERKEREERWVSSFSSQSALH
jgi:hypothetical protein